MRSGRCLTLYWHGGDRPVTGELLAHVPVVVVEVLPEERPGGRTASDLGQAVPGVVEGGVVGNRRRAGQAVGETLGAAPLDGAVAHAIVVVAEIVRVPGV